MTPERPHNHPTHSRDALQRQKRNWVWNQFFVLEEYTGMEPLYVGKSLSSIPLSSLLLVHTSLSLVFQRLVSSLRLLLLRTLESCSLLVPYPCLPILIIHFPFLRQSKGVRPVLPSSESVYHGPPPTIPKFTRPDPSEFTHLRISLENLLLPDGNELFKYHILVDHLKLDKAKMIADAYLNSPTPFTDTMSALCEKYGQPHQLALRRIASVLDSPDVRRGDVPAFQKFAFQVQSLVGLLRNLGHEGELELSCGSHVARLLSKLGSGYDRCWDLRPLHNVNIGPSSTEDPATVEKSCLTSFSSDRFFCDKPYRVMLKVVPVHLHYEDRTLDTFALLDDRSE
ncbi:unnamed protein product [Leuciscus chuanchicus]